MHYHAGNRTTNHTRWSSMKPCSSTDLVTAPRARLHGPLRGEKIYRSLRYEDVVGKTLNGSEWVGPAVIGVSIGMILGMVVGIAWLPHVIRHLGIRWGLVLVAIFLGSVLFRLHQGIGVFTFVLVLAAGLGLLWDLLR